MLFPISLFPLADSIDEQRVWIPCGRDLVRAHGSSTTASRQEKRPIFPEEEGSRRRRSHQGFAELMVSTGRSETKRNIDCWGGTSAERSWYMRLVLSYEFSSECSEIVRNFFEPLFRGSGKIPQNSCQISHRIFLQKSKTSPTSLCRSAGRTDFVKGIWWKNPPPSFVGRTEDKAQRFGSDSNIAQKWIKHDQNDPKVTQIWRFESLFSHLLGHFSSFGVWGCPAGSPPQARTKTGRRNGRRPPKREGPEMAQKWQGKWPDRQKIAKLILVGCPSISPTIFRPFVATSSTCHRGPKPQNCPKWSGEGAKVVLANCRKGLPKSVLFCTNLTGFWPTLSKPFAPSPNHFGQFWGFWSL